MFAGSHLHNPVHQGFTVGTVVDTNDPQQTGRIKVMVPSYGDRPDYSVGDLPWAVFVSPFGGTVNNDKIKRGAEEKQSEGPVGYGFWNIPKIGATVIVTCLDGDPMSRVWVGCLHTERLNHTLPHGRFIYENGEPDGPLDSHEKPIQPLYDNHSSAFGSRSGNYEWRTRGADYSATATADEFYIEDGINKKADTKEFDFTPNDGKTFHVTQGYGLSQIEPELKSKATEKNYDSQVYSWTTPGFHSISMDDRKENCRVKIRTTAGHQIILDDTNERIYINTCEGKNWIELDQDGNIDVYATTKVNVRTEGDINLTADKTIRMHAGEAIYMYTKDMRIQTIADYHVKVGAHAKIHSVNDMNLQTDASFHAKAADQGRITSGNTLHLRSTGDNIVETGLQIHLNGPTAQEAAAANEKFPKWTNRVPAHEPYARMTIKYDGAGNAGDETSVDSSTVGSHDPKYSNYDDPAIGSEDKTRGKYWRR